MKTWMIYKELIHLHFFLMTNRLITMHCGRVSSHAQWFFAEISGKFPGHWIMELLELYVWIPFLLPNYKKQQK